MGESSGAVDLIRWAFDVDPDRREAIESYLVDLGLEVYVEDGSRFVVCWDEPQPDDDPDAIVEALWELHGAPFEVTHEEFRRLGISTYHPADEAGGAGDETGQAA